MRDTRLHYSYLELLVRLVPILLEPADSIICRSFLTVSFVLSQLPESGSMESDHPARRISEGLRVSNAACERGLSDLVH
jgi:hypothetical protein